MINYTYCIIQVNDTRPVHKLLGIFWATFHFSGNFFVCEQLFSLRATLLVVAAFLFLFHLLKVLLALKREIMFIL